MAISKDLCMAQTEFEIGAWDCTTVRDGADRTINNATDKNLATVLRRNTDENKVIIYDWTACGTPATV